MTVKEKNVINDLVFFDNTKIVQNKDYFKFSLDSIILPNFVEINSNKKKIIDLCAGNIPIPLILCKKTNSKIYAIELQKEIFDLAEQTLNINGLNNKIELINDNVKNLKNLFGMEYFDIVTCNPPYFKVTENSNLNQNIVKASARHEISISLSEIIEISKLILKNNGDLYLINRTERFVETLELLTKNNIQPKRIRFIYPKQNKKSNLFLIMGKKNGNQGLILEPPLYIHNNDGSYTKEIIKMFS